MGWRIVIFSPHPVPLLTVRSKAPKERGIKIPSLAKEGWHGVTGWSVYIIAIPQTVFPSLKFLSFQQIIFPSLRGD